MLLRLIRVTICVEFYVVGAYATTDILRLLKGHPVPMGDSSCFCVILFGKRGRELAKGLLLSLLGNAVNFSLVGVLFFFHMLVQSRSIPHPD